MATSEILQKSRTVITAQGSGTALTATYDPNDGSYTGDTPATIDNTYDGGSENAQGADAVNLELNVTAAPSSDAVGQIWYRESNDGTNWTRWRYSQTVGEDILSSGVARYDGGFFALSALYTQLAVVADDYAFTAALYATPILHEAQ